MWNLKGIYPAAPNDQEENGGRPVSLFSQISESEREKKGNKSPKLETLSEHDKSEADTADW